MLKFGKSVVREISFLQNQVTDDSALDFKLCSNQNEKKNHVNFFCSLASQQIRPLQNHYGLLVEVKLH